MDGTKSDINAYFWALLTFKSFFPGRMVVFHHHTGSGSGLEPQWWISWTGEVNKAFISLVKLLAGAAEEERGL